MCGGQRLCEYSPTARTCVAMYQFVILSCVFYFLWFSLVTPITVWIHYTCKCGRTHAQNAGVEKLPHALMPTQFFSFPQNILPIQRKKFLSQLFFSIKWLFGRNKTALGRLDYETLQQQYIASYKNPIRFFLREKININGLFGFHKVMPTFQCGTTQKSYGNTLMAHGHCHLYSYSSTSLDHRKEISFV